MARSNERYVYLSVALPKDSPLLVYLRERRKNTGRHEGQGLVDLAMDALEMKTNGSSIVVPSQVSSNGSQMPFLQGPTESEAPIDFDSFGDPD